MTAHLAANFESWSTAWTEGIYRACIQGGLFAICVWLVCRALPNMPPRFRHWLWWLACLKLVLTFLPISPFRIAVLPGEETRPALRHETVPSTSSPSESGPVTADTVPSGKPAIGPTSVASVTPQSAAPKEVQSSLSWTAAVLLVWIGGLVCYLAAASYHILRIRMILRRSRSLDIGPVGEETRRLGILFELTRLPHVVESAEVTAPMVTGIIRPTILLPVDFAESLSAEELRMTLAHELAHVRQGDLWLALVPSLSQAIFFFFPPAWIACREWETAREASSDAAAIEKTGASASDYGRLLVSLVTRDSRGSLVPALGTTASYHTLRSRLLLLRTAARKLSRRTRVAQAGLALLAAAACLPAVLTPRQAQSDPRFRTLIERLGPGESAEPTADEYSITALFPETVETSEAYAINAKGQVVGSYERPDGFSHAFIWENGKARDLGALAERPNSVARGISDSGRICGYSYMRSVDRQAVVWEPDGTMVRLSPFGADMEAQARGINDRFVVGSSGRDEATGAVRWNGYTPESLHAFQTYSVNESGHSAGVLRNSAGIDHAMYWRDGVPKDLGTLGGPSSYAYCINSRDRIVGSAETSSDVRRACIWMDGNIVELGSLGGLRADATGINDRLQAVGSSLTGSGEVHAFIWDARRGLRDLNSLIPSNSGWVLVEAWDINDSGSIAGIGRRNGKRSAFVLTPGASAVSSSREPEVSSAIDYRRSLEGRRAKRADDPSIFLVLDGKRHLVPYPDVYLALFGTEVTREVTILKDLNVLPLGEPLSDDAFLGHDGTGAIYLISKGTKRLIADRKTVEKYVFFGSTIRMSEAALALPSGPDIRSR